ncbi:MAG: FHIPEP family type III secretion protein [Myxococcales bacterium]|jgi:type III secretion protein V|nr:FHIPEP family type III secretion protein [Myxococcales bacterium]
MRSQVLPWSPLRKGRLGGAELALAGLVIAVVAMMIVPLPTPLLDVLIATNLSLAVAILLVVLYVSDALAIATFPTILLLTTLFRLALNVSSTRLILLQADAGEVIKAFGGFVVRGNYVVGGVVFLILTIIQFIVIAKGSERVAEVGARFVLDAMPGKQMAIDAELRSGTIDGNEARRRRRALARESQFYGAMDGAMKFVKGDVVASLVIAVINVVGGLVIGVVQRGMTPVDALKRYGLLTIGDGLVSQIPALILSTAAGVLVTRVASESEDSALGEELASQVFGMPKALTVAAVFVLLLAIVPGLPALPFVVIGGLFLVIARARSKQMRREAAQPEPAAPAPGAKRAGPRFVPMVVPWSVDLADDLADLTSDRGGEETPTLRDALGSLRESLFAELGVPLPAARIARSEELGPRTVVLSLFEVPAKVLVVPPSDDPAAGVAMITAEAGELLRGRAADFLGLAETQRLLDELEQIAPAVVRNVIPKPVSLPLLADVLRRLVEERVSVRDLRGILEGLAAYAGTEKDPLNLAELTRGQLRRAITFRLTQGASTLGVITLDPTIEDTIRRAITRTQAGAFLTLAPAAARDVVQSVRRAVGEAAVHGGTPVILTQPDIRRFVKKLVETDVPTAQVTSFAELLPEVSLRPLARAHLGGIG